MDASCGFGRAEAVSSSATCRSGWRVSSWSQLLARCSDEERARLLSGSASLALGALGRTDPERPNPSSDPLAPIHGLYWLVANLAELEPVLLIIDDAQWADAQTIRFLDYLVRRLADLPVLVVVSVRSGEPAEPAELDRLRLNAQRGHPATTEQGCRPEPDRGAARDEAGAEFSEACWRATAGNPFLVAELVRGLRDDAGEPGGDGAVAIAGLGPPNIARYMLVRLGRFGQDAISLAQAIAVLGGSPQLRHAAKLAGLPEEQSPEALRPASPGGDPRLRASDRLRTPAGPPGDL